MIGSQVPLERLELLATDEADEVIGKDQFFTGTTGSAWLASTGVWPTVARALTNLTHERR